ncbi:MULTISPECIES: CshA/CshB family fibrillar adhesin-related protein [unclassified Actinomyces]|uniref:CshA/CshB family fibrillar adhesin-related protein n=1 Tax=unclassified Actinomyces TaxID=2609248 RepID=UPI00331305FE
MGLANQREGRGRSGYSWEASWGTTDDPGTPGIVTFSVSCETYLFRTGNDSLTKADLPSLMGDSSNYRKLPMEGMVVADAESSSWTTRNREYIVVESPVQQYQLLERFRSPGCSTTAVAKMGSWTANEVSHDGLKIHSNTQQCASSGSTWAGPATVMFMKGATSLNVKVAGNGRSAVALGVVSYMDFGDAPAGYGVAGASFQPTWSGASVPLSSTPVNLFAASQDLATAGTALPHLGTTIDAESAQVHTDGADHDDTHGTDDEDGWSVTDIRTQPGATYTTRVTCASSDSAPVRAWIDWNRDGTFGKGEQSEDAACTGGSATLTWTVPDDVQRSVADESAATYTRVRIVAATDADQLPPTGVTTSGEVEDYRSTSTSPPSPWSRRWATPLRRARPAWNPGPGP